ncbi:hypothetical protein GPECTOR_31g388 [Gonium pectorale]|uniref:Uncharacterized protein n=1 Tax=Gonium pectorale TaxID=33097 RepID=A0A150GDW3_GONPE|nr:hypothetical protein GPECTOR_31g388 [Gonium pectorale]|eukprot:KXZ48024.1 hypothetical protein GPECTOR_31g388 [Gonium pectorale]
MLPDPNALLPRPAYAKNPLYDAGDVVRATLSEGIAAGIIRNGNTSQPGGVEATVAMPSSHRHEAALAPFLDSIRSHQGDPMYAAFSAQMSQLYQVFRDLYDQDQVEIRQLLGALESQKQQLAAMATENTAVKQQLQAAASRERERERELAAAKQSAAAAAATAAAGRTDGGRRRLMSALSSHAADGGGGALMHDPGGGGGRGGASGPGPDSSVGGGGDEGPYVAVLERALAAYLGSRGVAVDGRGGDTGGGGGEPAAPEGRLWGGLRRGRRRRGLLAEPSLKADSLEVGDVAAVAEGDDGGPLFDFAVACGVVQVKPRHLNYTLTVRSMLGFTDTALPASAPPPPPLPPNATAAAAPAAAAPAGNGTATNGTAAEECHDSFGLPRNATLPAAATGPFAGRRCQRCPLLQPGTAYVALIVGDGGRSTGIVRLRFTTAAAPPPPSPPSPPPPPPSPVQAPG